MKPTMQGTLFCIFKELCSCECVEYMSAKITDCLLADKFGIEKYL